VSQQPENGSAPEAPEVAIEERRGISMIWLIPVVAGAIAIWLAYTTISEQGPEITISFKTAAGLEPGKTKVKYKDVDVGLVEEVEIKEDLSGIVITATLEKTASPHLNDETRFWVVRPRLGAGGISGLGTLVSGAYVEIDPGGGNPRRDFVGLEVPPVITSDVPGTEYRLKSDRLGSLGPGDPITYRGIRVGQILGYELNEDAAGVTFVAFVQAPHDKLVRDDTRFWNASGLQIKVGAEGVEVKTETLETLLAGGIVFSTPLGALRQEPSAPDTEFLLYDSEESIEEAAIEERLPLLLYFDGSVRGLNAGAPVELRGLRIGTVKDVRLEYNADDKTFRVPVVITIEPTRITILGERETTPYGGLDEFVERGLRAQLRSGNLLTGQLLVALDFFPDAPPEKVDYSDVYPVLPTIPSEIEQLTRSVGDVLEKVANLQLEELVGDLRATVQSAQKLVSSPEVTEAVTNLNRSLESVESVLGKVNKEVGPLVESLRRTSEAAEATLVSTESMVGENSQIRYDLSQLLQELTEAARSIRLLADYLEQNPNALLSGKGGANE